MGAGAFYAHGSGLIGRNARYVAGRADDSSHRVLNRAFPIPSASYCRRGWTRRGKIGRRNPSLSCIRRRNADRLGPSGLSLVARTPSLLIIDRILRLTCRRRSGYAKSGAVVVDKHPPSSASKWNSSVLAGARGNPDCVAALPGYLSNHVLRP
jgi:hypothetical protein